MNIGVVHANVALAGDAGQSVLERAVNMLLASVDAKASVLWSLRFTQLGNSFGENIPDVSRHPVSERVLSFPPPSLDLAFDDSVIDRVRTVWKMIMGDEVDDSQFLQFEDREGALDDDAV